MNSEPTEPAEPTEPMDPSLLKLERELFSLSPVETPRPLVTRLQDRVMGPVGVERRVDGRNNVRVGDFKGGALLGVAAAGANDGQRVIPWRKFVLPAAAAAVVAVGGASLREKGDEMGVRSAGGGVNGGLQPAEMGGVSAPGTSYVLKAESIDLVPVGASAGGPVMPTGTDTATGTSGYGARRASGYAPVVFH